MVEIIRKGEVGGFFARKLDEYEKNPKLINEQADRFLKGVKGKLILEEVIRVAGLELGEDYSLYDVVHGYIFYTKLLELVQDSAGNDVTRKCFFLFQKAYLIFFMNHPEREKGYTIEQGIADIPKKVIDEHL